MDTNLKAKEGRTWQCPDCQWIMNEIEYLSVKCDAGCGRCGKSLASFRKIKI